MTVVEIAEEYIRRSCRYKALLHIPSVGWYEAALVIREAEEYEPASCKWTPPYKRTSGETRARLSFVLARGWKENVLDMGFMGIVSGVLTIDAVEQKRQRGMDRIWRLSIAGRSRGRSVTIHPAWTVELAGHRCTGFTLHGAISAVLRPYVNALTGST